MGEKKKPQTIEELRARHQQLEKLKFEASVNLQAANQQLASLKAEAKAQWGTDDLAELEKKLQAMREENEQKRAQYQQHLDSIEGTLKEIDQKFRGPTT